MAEFALICPHCNASNDDPFEVFEQGKFDWTSCVGCNKPIHYFIGECAVCEAETPFTWAVEPVGTTPSDLKCGKCGSRYGQQHEAEHGSETQL